MRRLSDGDATTLFVAIVNQAVEDYRTLVKHKKAHMGNRNEGRYSIEEIHEFFMSDWGESIIQDGLYFKALTGSDFLRACCE